MLNPRDVATIVLRYYDYVEYARATGKFISWNRPVVPLIDDLTPRWYSQEEWGIPGRKPVGYIHPDSPARLLSLGEVQHALAQLESSNPSAYHTLREELAPPASGEALDSEWRDAYLLHKAAQEAKAEMTDILESGGSPKRLKSVTLKYSKLLAQASPRMARKTHAVLDAAQELAKFLPQKEWGA